MRKLTLWLLLCAALCAARGLAWAEVMPEAQGGALANGALAAVNLDRGEQVYTFTPTAGSVCDICLFPAGETPPEVEARLYQGEALLETGTGMLTVISRRLSAGVEYTLRLHGSGAAFVEVARHTLSRCYDVPMALEADGDSYAKAIARQGDVHWYAVTAEASRPVTLVGMPANGGPALEARLFSDSGRLLAEATRTAGGAFLLDFMPRSGRTYRVRVSSPEGGTGMYSLMTAQGEGRLPEALLLSREALKLNGRESRRLTAEARPEGASGAVFWESSDPAVAQVAQTGLVTGGRPGVAMITAYASGAIYARCRVEVAQVPVRGVRLFTDDIDVNAGDDVALEWTLVPENASEPGVSFEVIPAEGIAEVDASGVLRALEAGEADVIVRTLDGGFEASASLHVHPPLRRCRALLVGEQNYAATVANPRLGSANSVTGLRSMLNQLNVEGCRFEVRTALDASRDAVLKAIQTAFDGAADQDVALFYITCHGFYADGMTCFQMYDGSILTAQELRRAFDRVPGTVWVLADCCGSGGVIGRASVPGDILRGVDGVFGGAVGPSAFTSSRYRVLASASVEQDSYRIGFDPAAGESGMATVFARAVCEGCGWDIDSAERGPLRADADGDGGVSLDELYRFAARRVREYLSMGDGSYAQTVRVWPEGACDTVLMANR